MECGALVLKYEDLVSQERRFSTLKNLYSYLDVPLSDSAIDTIGARVVDRSSRTFRKGIVGSYKQELPNALADKITEESNYFCRFYS